MHLAYEKRCYTVTPPEGISNSASQRHAGVGLLRTARILPKNACGSWKLWLTELSCETEGIRNAGGRRKKTA